MKSGYFALILLLQLLLCRPNFWARGHETSARGHMRQHGDIHGKSVRGEFLKYRMRHRASAAAPA